MSWNERDHPRDDQGQFTEKAGAGWASRIAGAIGGRHVFRGGHDLVAETDWEPIQESAMGPGLFGADSRAIDWRVVQRQIYQMQGFDALPHVVDRQEMDRLVNQEGYRELFRGVGSSLRGESGVGKLERLTAEQTAQLFRDAPQHWVGDGFYGVGTYAVVERETAATFGDAILRMGLHPDARVYTYRSAQGMAGLPEPTTEAGQYALTDVGTRAAAAGYDAILVPSVGRIRGSGGDYYVILNRGAVAVQEADR